MSTVAALLPGPAGDGSWVDAAHAALDRLTVTGDVVVTVHEDVPDVLPAADVVLCHGIQYEPLVRAAGPGRVVVMSDHPGDLAALDHVTVIDWAWHEAARLAGRFAAEISGGGPVALVAGPAVRTQVLVAASFTAGVAAAGHAAPEVVHLRSFDDVAGGEAAGARLAAAGCRVLLASADGAGDAAAAVARTAGVATIGFLHPHADDLAHIASDVSGVLHDAVRSALETGASGGVVHAGLASGRLGLVLRGDELPITHP